MSYGVYPSEQTYEKIVFEEIGNGGRLRNSSFVKVTTYLPFLSLLIILMISSVFVSFYVNFGQDYCRACGIKRSPLIPNEESDPIIDNNFLHLGLISDVHLAVKPDSRCRTAAKFGLYGCDSNEALVNATLDDMANRFLSTPRHAVLMLGDVSKHKTNNSQEVVLENNARFFGLLRDRFSDVPVFCILGNNDLPEHNELPPKSWYSNFLSNYLSAIKPATPSTFPKITLPASFNETFLSGGYYSATYKDLLSTFTVIGLNTIIFHCKVSDVIEQELQASAQLVWLERTLEESPGKVIIIGHHPLSINFGRMYQMGRILPDWKSNYYTRFRGITKKHHEKIIGMFCGHEHLDTVMVDNWQDSDLAIFGVASISPSFSGEPSYEMAVLDEDLNLKDLRTYNAWLDMKSEHLEFAGFSSLTEIMGISSLETIAIKNKLENLNSVLPNGLGLYQKLKNKINGGRFFPREITMQLFYCYSTSMLAQSFSDCIQRLGYPEEYFKLEIV